MVQSTKALVAELLQVATTKVTPKSVAQSIKPLHVESHDTWGSSLQIASRVSDEVRVALASMKVMK
jgi:hypothetical protein